MIETGVYKWVNNNNNLRQTTSTTEVTKKKEAESKGHDTIRETRNDKEKKHDNYT